MRGVRKHTLQQNGSNKYTNRSSQKRPKLVHQKVRAACLGFPVIRITNYKGPLWQEPHDSVWGLEFSLALGVWRSGCDSHARNFSKSNCMDPKKA